MLCPTQYKPVQFEKLLISLRTPISKCFNMRLLTLIKFGQMVSRSDLYLEFYMNRVAEIVNNFADTFYVVCQKTLPRIYRKKQQT